MTLLTAGGAFSAAAKKLGGIWTRLYLYNYEDWLECTVVRDTGGAITSITNATGLKAFDFSVADSGNLIPTAVLRAVDGGQDGFDHQIDSKLFDVSFESRKNLAEMRFTKVVAILEDINGKGYLYGEGIGLRMSDYQENPGDASLGNIVQFVIKTPDNDPPEIEPPVDIWDTDRATTKVILDALIVAGT